MRLKVRCDGRWDWRQDATEKQDASARIQDAIEDEMQNTMQLQEDKMLLKKDEIKQKMRLKKRYN